MNRWMREQQQRSWDAGRYLQQLAERRRREQYERQLFLNAAKTLQVLAEHQQEGVRTKAHRRPLANPPRRHGTSATSGLVSGWSDGCAAGYVSALRGTRQSKGLWRGATLAILDVDLTGSVSAARRARLGTVRLEGRQLEGAVHVGDWLLAIGRNSGGAMLADVALVVSPSGRETRWRRRDASAPSRFQVVLAIVIMVAFLAAFASLWLDSA